MAQIRRARGSCSAPEGRLIRLFFLLVRWFAFFAGHSLGKPLEETNESLGGLELTLLLLL